MDFSHDLLSLNIRLHVPSPSPPIIIKYYNYAHGDGHFDAQNAFQTHSPCQSTRYNWHNAKPLKDMETLCVNEHQDEGARPVELP